MLGKICSIKIIQSPVHLLLLHKDRHDPRSKQLLCVVTRKCWRAHDMTNSIAPGQSKYYQIAHQIVQCISIRSPPCLGFWIRLLVENIKKHARSPCRIYLPSCAASRLTSRHCLWRTLARVMVVTAPSVMTAVFGHRPCVLRLDSGPSRTKRQRF